MSGWICFDGVVWGLYIILLLPIFIYKESQVGAEKAVGYKLTLSFAFCMVGLMGVLRHINDRFTILVFLGLVFSLGGDYYLVHIKGEINKYLKGIFSFSVALLLYVLAIILNTGIHIFEVIITLVLLMPVIIVKNIKKPIMGKAELPLTIYIALATFMAVKAVMMIYYANNISTFQVLFIAGAFLFYLSDIILGAWRYLELKKIYAYLVYVLYFTGQLMIASAILF